MVWRWMVALVVVLAGCSEAPAAPVEQTDDYEEFRLEETAVELGVVRGVVVDIAIQPLAGAFVSLVGQTTNVTTAANGAFAFKDVEPGIYFIEAIKPGFGPTQVSTEVVAGVKDPPVLRLLIQRLPGTEPDIQADTFQGHITCSVRIPAAGFNDGCGVFGNLGLGSTQRKQIAFPAGNIQWVQTELTWAASMQTAERLCSTVTGIGAGCGASPLIRAIDEATVDDEDLDKGDSYEYVVYPDHLAGGASGNLVVEQSFELISHAFYNFLPPEGWQFGRDGLPPIPA